MFGFRRKNKNKESDDSLLEKRSVFNPFKSRAEDPMDAYRDNNLSPYQVQIENTTDEKKKAVLFGFNHNWRHPNLGSDDGIIIDACQPNVDYAQIVAEIAHESIKTSLIRIQSSNTSQVTQIITIFDGEATGRSVAVPIITQSYFSAMQFQSGIIDVPFNVGVSGQTQFELEILPKTKVVLAFFFTKKSDEIKEALLAELKQLGVSSEAVEELVYQRDKRLGKAARKAARKLMLKMIFSFKWLIPKKKEKPEKDRKNEFPPKFSTMEFCGLSHENGDNEPVKDKEVTEQRMDGEPIEEEAPSNPPVEEPDTDIPVAEPPSKEDENAPIEEPLMNSGGEAIGSPAPDKPKEAPDETQTEENKPIE